MEAHLAEHQRVLFENKLLHQALRLARIEKYGKRSETLSDDQLSLLEEEPSVTAADVETEAQRFASEATVPKPKRDKNQNHPGRVELPAHLERREVIVQCQGKDAQCEHCGQERPIIGYEITEELDIEPVKAFVRVVKREKRGSHCLPEQGVATAPCPAKIIPRSKLSNELIIDVVIAKYEQHIPVYRQCGILEREAGVELSRQTLVGLIMSVGGLLESVSRSLRKDLLNGRYLQVDETPVPCQTRRSPGKNHQAYMWEYSRPGGPVVFDFKMGRGREGPLKFLNGFRGILQTDGYAAYNRLGDGIVYAACWSHARRQFHRAHLLMPNDPVPLEILNLIKELYRVEAQARQDSLTPEQRLVLRQRCSAAIVEELKKRIIQIQQDQPPSAQLAKACKYALGQWTRLEEFLKHGELEIDNNWCENAIRPLALGRRNWLHIGSEIAGPKVAAIVSIIETCHRLKINARDYFRDVLPKLAEWPANRVAELSPLAWKASQAQ